MKKTEKLMDKKPKDKYVLYSEFNEFRDEITSRIDNLETRMDTRIDNLETRIDARMGNLDIRIENLEVNISKILTILESK